MIDIILSCLNTFPVSDADVKPMGVENKIIQNYLTFWPGAGDFPRPLREWPPATFIGK